MGLFKSFIQSLYLSYYLYALIQFSHSVMSDSLQPHEPQHTRPTCPSPTPSVHPNPCPLSRWCHPTILSSVISFFSHLQSVPASGSFQMSQFFTSGGTNIGVSASTSMLPMNIQDSFPLGVTGLISLQSKRLSRVDFFGHFVTLWRIRTTNLISQIIDYQGTCDPCHYCVLLLRLQTWNSHQTPILARSTFGNEVAI